MVVGKLMYCWTKSVSQVEDRKGLHEVKKEGQRTCLEHIPVWDYIEVAIQQCIVCIDEDMPRVAVCNGREEVVRVAMADWWRLVLQQAMEDGLRCLRHARHGLHDLSVSPVSGPILEVTIPCLGSACKQPSSKLSDTTSSPLHDPCPPNACSAYAAHRS